MHNASIDFILRKMFVSSARELVVDGGDEFLEFRRDADSGIRSGTNSTSASGQILYRSKRGKIRTSPHLFVKLSPDILSLDTHNLQLHINEVHFYSKIQPCFQKLRSTDGWLSKFYASHLDVAGEYGCTEILVLEDLRPSGFSACRVKDGRPLDLAHLTLMMRKVGEFHAYSYKARVVDCDRFCGLVHSLQNVFLSFTQWMRPRTVQRLKMACEPLREDGRYADALAKFDDILENFYDFVAASLAAEGEGGSSASVLCHLSFSRSNALFRYDAEEEKPVDAIMVDWQTCLPSNIGVDILTALYVDTDQETRDKHWDVLIDEYYRALSQTFSDITVPNKDEVVENLKMKVGATLQLASSRIPHKNFSAYEKIQFTSTSESGKGNYVDPLTSILKDMIDRKLFC